MAPRAFEPLSATSRLERNAALVVALTLLFGAACISHLEAWSLADSLYFACVVLTTVGYGDLAPKTPAGRLFTALYVLVGVTLGAAGLGAMVGKAQAAISRRASQAGHAAAAGHTPTAALGAAAVTAGGIVLAGVVGGAFGEGWTLVDSLYWAVVTCSSVGFGDLAPSAANRSVAGLYILVAVGGFASAVGRVASTVASRELERQVADFVARGVSPELIAEIDRDRDGCVGRDEFLRYMLVATGKLDAHEIKQIDSQFDALDADGSGSLSAEDIACSSASRGRKPTGGKVVPMAPALSPEDSLEDDEAAYEGTAMLARRGGYNRGGAGVSP